MSRCMFCGELLNAEGVCPNAAQHFKPMCLNCQHVGFEEENCLCCNDENKNEAIKRIMDSFEGGYEITGVTLKPLPLKDPTKKCKRHVKNLTALTDALSKLV